MNLIDDVQFDRQGLVPVILQDADTHAPITLAYMDREALARTLETKRIHVFRRSKGRVMMKGETSGMTQEVVETRIDCMGKSLLLRVKPSGPGCHEGFPTCYYRRWKGTGDGWETTEERGFDPAEVYSNQK